MCVMKNWEVGEGVVCDEELGGGGRVVCDEELGGGGRGSV